MTTRLPSYDLGDVFLVVMIVVKMGARRSLQVEALTP